MKQEFTAKDIERIFGLSRQRLHQLRIEDIITPSIQTATQGAHNKYSFEDLMLIAVVVKMFKTGIDQNSMKLFLPDIQKYLENNFKLSKPADDDNFLVLRIRENGIWSWGPFLDTKELKDHEESVLISLDAIEKSLKHKIKNL
jgi:hypothetical protein